MSQPRKGGLVQGPAFGNASISKVPPKRRCIRPGFFQRPWVQSSTQSDFLTLGLSPKRLYLCQQRRLGWNLPPRRCNKRWLQLPYRLRIVVTATIRWSLNEYFQADSYECLAGSKTSVPVALLVSRSCGVKEWDEEVWVGSSKAGDFKGTHRHTINPWLNWSAQRFVTLLLCSHAAAILEAIRPLRFMVQDSRNIAFDSIYSI